MKALVFSDTHGRINKTIEIIDAHKNVDLIIHLGDLVRDAEDLGSIFTNKKVEYVSGNNDFYSFAPTEKIITIDNKKLLITHGHRYSVKFDYDKLYKRGKEAGVDCVLFGHTHIAFENYNDNILFLNPGSISLPKDGPSYGIIEVNDNKLNYMICKI